MWKTIFITVAAAIFGILGFLAYDAVAHGYHRRGAGQAEFDALYEIGRASCRERV